MAEEALTKEYLDESLEKLGGMIKRSFDDVYKRFDNVEKSFDDVYKRFDNVDKRFEENTEQHRQIFVRLDRIEMKLEGVVYRREFDELKGRVDALENLLAVKKKT